MSEPLRFTLPLPPSANRLYRAHVVPRTGMASVRKSREYRIYSEDAANAMLATKDWYKLKKALPEGPLSFTARLYWPDRRIRDVDNALKSLQDVVSQTLQFDDSRFSEVHAYRLHDKKNPRVEVEISSASEAGEAA